MADIISKVSSPLEASLWSEVAMLGFVGQECTQQVFSDHFTGGSVVFISSEFASSL